MLFTSTTSAAHLSNKARAQGGAAKGEYNDVFALHTSPTMKRANGIRKLGFRRWYERQLIESHAYLVTCFLCMILIAACVETFSFRAPGWQPVAMIMLLLAGAAGCVLSWRRYLDTLMRAEQIGEQSTCSACGTYGRYKVLDPAPSGDGPAAGWAGSDPQPELRLKVSCRSCKHEWTIQ